MTNLNVSIASESYEESYDVAEDFSDAGWDEAEELMGFCGEVVDGRWVQRITVAQGLWAQRCAAAAERSRKVEIDEDGFVLF